MLVEVSVMVTEAVSVTAGPVAVAVVVFVDADKGTLMHTQAEETLWRGYVAGSHSG